MVLYKSAFMTPDEMRAHPEILIRQDNGKHGDSSRFEGSTVPEFAIEFLPKDGTILECGPIRGVFTKFLQDNGYKNIHVLDFINLLEHVDKKSVTAHELNLNSERFPYDDAKFDGATAWGIGEHLENPFHFCREVARVLKPGCIFIFSVPNVFHLISRLVFLRNGMFPRWSYRNNHISVLPRGVFHKTILRDFDLIETRYVKPRFMYLFFDRFAKWLPKNQWFGDYEVHILRKKAVPLRQE